MHYGAVKACIWADSLNFGPVPQCATAVNKNIVPVQRLCMRPLCEFYAEKRSTHAHEAGSH